MALKGVSLYDVAIGLLQEGREVTRTRGDVLFTHFGLSGPGILTLSGPAVDRLGQGLMQISIALMPNLDTGELDSRLRIVLGESGRRTVRTALRGLFPLKMVDCLLQRAGIAADRLANQVTAAERRKLRDLIEGLRFAIAGHRPLEEAIVTAGGVDTRQVDPYTLGSRLLPGLYFAGEVLDVQADTGGFNLQAAFSTGYIAGRAAAQFVADRGGRSRDGVQQAAAPSGVRGTNG
jgi:hypothetical protein